MEQDGAAETQVSVLIGLPQAPTVFVISPRNAQSWVHVSIHQTYSAPTAVVVFNANHLARCSYKLNAPVEGEQLTHCLCTFCNFCLLQQLGRKSGET